MAATAPERSRNLHNFSLPPRLSWGSQRLLRCSKLNNNSSNFTSSKDDVSFPDRKRRNVSFRSPPPPQPASSIHHEDNHQIEVMREKLMLDLRSEVEQIRATFLEDSNFAPPPPPESRPWNLRARRSPATAEITPPTTTAVCASGERAKFSVPLAKQEIEDDFVRITGRRPPRKPKKRPRYVQKHLDTLFPGLWLSEITPDMYKVQENPELHK